LYEEGNFSTEQGIYSACSPPEISSSKEKRPLGDRQVGHQAARLRRPLPASMRDHSPAKKRESGCTVHAGRHVVLRIGNHKADAEGIAGSVEHLIDD